MSATWAFMLIMTDTVFSRFFMVKLKKDEHGRWSCPSRNENTQRYHALFYKHYDAIVYSYLPLSSMLFFNVAIVWKLVAAKCRKKTEGAVGSTALSKTSNSLTYMLIGTCLLFALLTTPYAVMYRLGAEVASYYFALWYQLIYMNHSINFFVYVIANNRFRKEVAKLFGCDKPSKVEPEGSTATTAAGTDPAK